MSSLRTLRNGAIVGLLLLTLAACGSSSSDDTSSSTTNEASTPLEGTQWNLSTSADLGVPVNGVTVTAEFNDGRISGSSGCNTYNGPYTVSGSKLTIGPDTRARGERVEPHATAVETAYLGRLPDVTSFKISDDTLTLLGDNDKTLLVYEASDGATAIKASWEATSYYTGTTIQSVIVGSTLTAAFDGTQISGESGCNTFSGDYKVDGTEIEIGPLRSTLHTCEKEDLQTQEQKYVAALELAKTFSVTATELTLFREDGGIAVTFQKNGLGG